MQTDIDPRDLIGHRAVDRNGDKIGTVDEVYLDDATGQPEWAAVRTGIFGRDAFVPLTTSEFSGEELRVPYDRSLVKESPDFGVGQHLSPAQELQLYRYYGLDTQVDDRSDPDFAQADGAGGEADLDFGTVAPAAAGAVVGTAAASGPGAAGVKAGRAERAEESETSEKADSPTPGPAAATAEAPPVPTPAAAPTSAPTVTSRAEAVPPVATPSKAGSRPPGESQAQSQVQSQAPSRPTAPGSDAATSSPGGPVEITCHEERLDVGTEWQATYTARLRKYVTSETVERHVPLVRERVRVERVRVTEGERDALTQEEIAEAVEEVTLREEVPVVRKYMVPVERVRLVVERYTDDHVVREELRREHVEIHDDSVPAGQAGHTAPGAAAPSSPAPPPSSSPAPQPLGRSRPEPLRSLG